MTAAPDSRGFVALNRIAVSPGTVVYLHWTASTDSIAACRLEALEACQPDLALYSEVVADDIAAALFPVNNLRNLAILSARTPLVLMANIDMLIGRSLTKLLQSSKG